MRNIYKDAMKLSKTTGVGGKTSANNNINQGDSFEDDEERY